MENVGEKALNQKKTGAEPRQAGPIGKKLPKGTLSSGSDD